MRGPIRRRAIVLLVLVASLLQAFAAVPAQAAAPRAAIPQDWLGRVNFYRAMAGLAPVTENPGWSAGDVLHSQYMVENNFLGHSEDPANRWYTAAGDTAARNSNLVVSSTTNYPDSEAIDEWMSGPFHALGIIDPGLQQAGFGAFRLQKPGYQAAAALDVYSGNSYTIPSSVHLPVLFPGNGATSPLGSFGGYETPDPLQYCPGYTVPTGAPIMMQFGRNATINVTSVTITDGGGQVPSCEFDLSNRGAVVIMPRQPLLAGHRYTVSAVVNGTTYRWWFAVVDAQAQPVQPPRPWSGGSDAVGAPPAAVAAASAYFAEGYTGYGFQEYLTVANLSPAAQTLTVDYLLRSGPPVTKTYNMLPSGRLTINVNDEVGPDQDVAAHLHTSGSPFVAERPMYFNFNGVTGGHDVVGAPAPGLIFNFAEGYTGPGFNEYLTFMNPDPSQVATAVVTYYYTNGLPPKRVGHTINPQSRLTAHVNDPAEAGPGVDVAAVVTSNIPIVAERPMYFTYGQWTGGHDVMGAPATATQFYFAEGFVGPTFQEYYTILNPDPTGTAQVDVSLHDSSGGVTTRRLNVPPASRTTFSVNAVLPAGTSNSAVITSVNGVKILAERPQYFSYGAGWDGGHDAMGTTALGTTWYFAEGLVGPTFEEYYTIFNPNPLAALVTLKFFNETGQVGTALVTVQPGNRATVKVNDVLPAGTSNSAIVTSTQPVLVERPMYFNY